MSKKQFTLDSWLKDKSQKVVTRCGFPVRIVCTDVKRKDYPILALVERDDQEEYQSFTKDGRFSLYNPLHDNFDLFIETADEVSEDKKILEIIKHCIESRYLHTSTIKGISQKQCLAWLEKQDKQEKDILEDAILDGNEDGLIAETIKYKHEKQGEQNLVLRDTFGYEDGRLFGMNEGIGLVLDNPEKYGLQKLVKWSKEDENVINLILSICNDFLESFEISPASTKVVKEDVDKIKNWLKSLKGRVKPQWKPSETDITILEDVFNGKINPKDFQATLLNVLEQLKKLKEGKV